MSSILNIQFIAIQLQRIGNGLVNRAKIRAVLAKSNQNSSRRILSVFNFFNFPVSEQAKKNARYSFANNFCRWNYFPTFGDRNAISNHRPYAHRDAHFHHLLLENKKISQVETLPRRFQPQELH